MLQWNFQENEGDVNQEQESQVKMGEKPMSRRAMALLLSNITLSFILNVCFSLVSAMQIKNS